MKEVIKNKFSIKNVFTIEIIIILAISILRLIVHLIFNGQYNFFRDEYYYIACGEHLDWGFVDHPPFTPLLANIERFLFGNSIFSIRLFPSIAASMIVFFTGLSAYQLGGKKTAVTIASLCALISPVFLNNGSILTTNIFDELFWTLVIFTIILIIKNEKPSYWMLTGLFLGIGLMNKHSVIFLCIFLIIGLLLTSNRKYFADKFLWIGLAIALIIFIPHIIWQIVNGFPTLEFMKNVSLYKNVKNNPIEFIAGQILAMHPFAFPIWLLGLFYLTFIKEGKKYILFGLIYLMLLIFFTISGGKDYYLAPIYPVLLASGGVFIEKLFKKFKFKILNPVFSICIFIILFFGGILTAPIVLPVLPPEKVQGYAKNLGITFSSGEKHIKLGSLPQVFADMFGWEELVQKISKAYNSLTPEEKTKCAILCENYGEAGAVDFWGNKYGLPKAISGFNSYFLWGPQNYTGEIMIIVNPWIKEEDLKKAFNTVIKSEFIYTDFAISHENNYYLYICKGLRNGTLKDIWKSLKNYY